MSRAAQRPVSVVELQAWAKGRPFVDDRDLPSMGTETPYVLKVLPSGIYTGLLSLNR
jgi:hypothetical protein